MKPMWTISGLVILAGMFVGCRQESSPGLDADVPADVEGDAQDVSDADMPSDGGEDSEVSVDVRDADAAPDTSPDVSRCSESRHLCDGRCVDDGSILNCGESCQLCEGSSNGDPICVGGECQLECEDGYRYCGGECARCPSGAQALACEDGACVATSCSQGRRLCDARCPTCPSNSESTTCDGTGGCIATSCPEDSHLCDGTCSPDDVPGSCGNRCSPCPSPPGARATCESETCRFRCKTGHWPCSQSSCCPWTRQEVTTAYNPNHLEFTVDSANQIHVVYHQRINAAVGAELRYRNVTTGATSQIDQTTQSGANLTGLKFDVAISPTTGRPIVAYGRNNQDPLVARLQADGTWSKSPISHLSDRTLIYAIEYHNGVLHLLGLEGISNSSQFKLSLSELSGNTWTHSDIDTDVWQPWADMAIDSAGNVVAVYTKNVGTRESVLAATNASGTWTTTTVVNVSSSQQQNVQADVEFSGGTPHVVLQYMGPSESSNGGDNLDLAHAYREKGTWKLEMLDTRNSAGVYPNIEFDASGKMYGFYQRGNTYQIAAMLNNEWRASSISSDTPPYPPFDSDLNLDDSGHPVVGYQRQGLNGIVFYK